MEKQKTSYWRSIKGAISILLIGIAGYILFIDHTRHLIEWLPLLLLGGCLLMHTMMHGGHSNHSKHTGSNISDEEDTNDVEHSAQPTSKNKDSHL